MDHVLARWYNVFHIVFAIAAVIAIVAVGVDRSLDPRDRVIAIVLAFSLIAWFWWRGHWSRLHSDRDILIYFVVLVPALTALLMIHDAFGLLIFAAYWQGFAYMRVGPAVGYSLILTVAIQIGYGSIGPETLRDLNVTPWGLIAIGVMVILSGMMAMYIESFAREADKRAALLNELRSAQDALALREREAGVREERQRFSAEIHDTIAQQFTSIVTNLSAADVRLRSNPEAAMSHVASALAAARQGIEDSRRMVSALQPEILTGRSIDEALRQVAGSAHRTYGLRVRFEESGDPAPMNRVHEAILVRALQESLGNIHKHAQSDRSDITLTWQDDDMILDVSDDGIGFDPGEIFPSSDGHQMGLTTMQTRVEGAGGSWMMESHPGEGTSIAISFPIDRDTSGDLQ